MIRNRVIGAVHAIGLVVADREIFFARQALEEDPARARVSPVVKDPDVPRPRLAGQDGREAVERYDERRTARPPLRELGRDPFVIRRMNGAATLFARFVGKAGVSRHRRSIGYRQDGVARSGVPVAVDHQSRKRLADERRFERLREVLPQGSNPRVPGDVTGAVHRGEPEVTERGGNRVASVVSQQQQVVARARANDDNGRRIRLAE